jgi:hypothetical protein
MKAIITPETNQYFSLLGSPHFTSNVEIAQRFLRDYDAHICIESEIDSNEGFEKFGMIFCEIVTIN